MRHRTAEYAICKAFDNRWEQARVVTGAGRASLWATQGTCGRILWLARRVSPRPRPQNATRSGIREVKFPGPFVLTAMVGDYC